MAIGETPKRVSEGTWSRFRRLGVARSIQDIRSWQNQFAGTGYYRKKRAYKNRFDVAFDKLQGATEKFTDLTDA
jgi:hypothetical protein